MRPGSIFEARISLKSILSVLKEEWEDTSLEEKSTWHLLQVINFPEPVSYTRNCSLLEMVRREITQISNFSKYITYKNLNYFNLYLHLGNIKCNAQNFHLAYLLFITVNFWRTTISLAWASNSLFTAMATEHFTSLVFRF